MSSQTIISSRQQDDTRSYFSKVFQWMGIALAISGAVAYFVSINPAIIETLFSSRFGLMLMLIVEIGLVLYLSARIQTMSLQTAQIMFVVYSIVSGFTLSVIFLVFQLSSIVTIFGASAALFLVVAFYGFSTKTDLTSVGNMAIMGLVGIIIGGIINIFLRSSTLDFIITSLGVIIFVALIAYDVQKLKRLNSAGDIGTENEGKEAIIGALTLYLDFVNLFLKLLRLFGKRR